jgi:hypothetical protein
MQFYKLNKVEKNLVLTQITKLLDVGLVELSRGEYVSTKSMPTKDIFGNGTKRYMCGDYCSMNKRTCLDKYAMPLPEEIFHAFG